MELGRELLKLTKGNAKLTKQTLIFSLPAGYTCPAARVCKTFCTQKNDGRYTIKGNTNNALFWCYAAGEEVRFPNVRKLRRRNYTLLRNLKTKDEIVKLITRSLLLHTDFDKVRIHESGDFYSEAYFLAWAHIARENPEILFYAYTKSLDYWVRHMNEVPDNLILTASYGGVHDAKIKKHNLRYVKVAFSLEDAGDLPIDHDDTLAFDSSVKAFAVLLHGMQPQGSEASKSLSAMRKNKVKFSYPLKEVTV